MTTELTALRARATTGETFAPARPRNAVLGRSAAAGLRRFARCRDFVPRPRRWCNLRSPTPTARSSRPTARLHRDSETVTVGGCSSPTPLQYDGNPRATADQVAELEKAGLDMVWVAEAYGFDSPTLMGYLAAKTERLQIAAGILNVFSRTPGAILQTAAGLDNVSARPGGARARRLRAAGDRGLPRPALRQAARPHPRGDPARPLRPQARAAASRTGIFNIPLPEGQGLGLGKPLKILDHPERDTIPIWVASLGDKNVEMTAELADGWLPILFIPEQARDVWGDVARRRRRQARPRARPAADQRRRHGRDRRGRARGCSTSCARCTRSTSAAWAPAARTSTTSWPSTTATRRRPRRSRTSTSTARRRRPRRSSRWSGSRQSNLVGPASYVQERIAAFEEAGVSHLSIVPASDDPAGHGQSGQGLGVVRLASEAGPAGSLRQPRRDPHARPLRRRRPRPDRHPHRAPRLPLGLRPGHGDRVPARLRRPVDRPAARPDPAVRGRRRQALRRHADLPGGGGRRRRRLRRARRPRSTGSTGSTATTRSPTTSSSTSWPPRSSGRCAGSRATAGAGSTRSSWWR